MTFNAKLYTTYAILALSVVLTSCASKPKSVSVGSNETAPIAEKGFLGLFKSDTTAKKSAEANIGVNAYLWRATLDTLSFMPLASADPWGGVIITDYYANPQKPDEKFKVTVYILDTRLRADALSISVFKQTLTPAGWVDADVSAQTQTDIENAILTRARELRLSDVK